MSDLEILELVNRRVGPAYEQVIESCFDLSRLQHGLRAEHLSGSLNKIVRPYVMEKPLAYATAK